MILRSTVVLAMRFRTGIVTAFVLASTMEIENSRRFATYLYSYGPDCEDQEARHDGCHAGLGHRNYGLRLLFLYQYNKIFIIIILTL